MATEAALVEGLRADRLQGAIRGEEIGAVSAGETVSSPYSQLSTACRFGRGAESIT